MANHKMLKMSGARLAAFLREAKGCVLSHEGRRIHPTKGTIISVDYKIQEDGTLACKSITVENYPRVGVLV